jgi:hypothetical protein
MYEPIYQESVLIYDIPWAVERYSAEPAETG